MSAWGRMISAPRTGISGRSRQIGVYSACRNATGLPETSDSRTPDQSAPERFSTTAQPCSRASAGSPPGASSRRKLAFHSGAAVT